MVPKDKYFAYNVFLRFRPSFGERDDIIIFESILNKWNFEVDGLCVHKPKIKHPNQVEHVQIADRHGSTLYIDCGFYGSIN